MKNFLLGLIASCAILIAASSFSSTANASPVTSLMSGSWIQELSHRVDTIKAMDVPPNQSILTVGAGQAFIVTDITRGGQGGYMRVFDSTGTLVTLFPSPSSGNFSTKLVLDEGETLACDTTFHGYVTGFWVNR